MFAAIDPATVTAIATAVGVVIAAVGAAAVTIINAIHSDTATTHALLSPPPAAPAVEAPHAQ